FGPDRRVLTLLFAEGGDNSCRSEDGGESPAENQTGVATCIDGGTQLGTSFAAPNLAGAAAVVRDYFAKGFYPDGTNTNPTNNTELVPTISANLIKALLVVGAQPLTNGKVVTPVDRFNYYWGYGRIQLNNSLPLAQFPTKSISGIIVHDLPGDIDGNGGADGVSSLSLPSTLATTLTSYTDEFEVLDNTEDLVASISWHDPVNSNGFVTNDVDLRIRYCGADANCTTPGDDIVWRGNIFSEDFDRNGTTNNDLNGNGQIDGYFYTIEQRTGMDTWRDNKNNVEAVFIPSIFNAVDKDNDGTDDVARLRTGQYRIEVERRSGSTVLNYAVAIGGPVTAGSSVRFDSNPLTCNADVSVLVNELEDGGDAQCPNTGNCPTSVIENRVTVQVLDAANVVVDTETGLGFTRTGTGLRFESARLPLSVTQPLGDDDGVLTVDDGHSLKVTYTDSSSTRSSVAAVDCRPDVELQFISQIDEDFPFLLGGGCDRDKFLDVGENFSMQIEYFNLDAIDLVDGEVGLKAVVPFPAGTPQATIDADPCRNTRPASPYIRVDNPVNQFALLPSQTRQRTNFVFEVVGTPPQRNVVELVLSLSGPKTGQPVSDCVAFEFLMQADEQINRYITDCRRLHRQLRPQPRREAREQHCPESVRPDRLPQSRLGRDERRVRQPDRHVVPHGRW
ncbi:MAG: hypothetical protein HC882_01335, partial [Acidobacteria bacterium]|nr:hypothetical protein [Acidobacteriota bacterium]